MSPLLGNGVIVCLFCSLLAAAEYEVFEYYHRDYAHHEAVADDGADDGGHHLHGYIREEKGHHQRQAALR